MVSVADLLIDNRIPSNFFVADAYVHSDLELGLLENRRGARLLAMPEPLLQAIYAGLYKETGQATRLVLFNCGRWWGKNFYARFCEDLTDYHHQPLADLPMIEFLQSLQQCWQTHGWGRIDLDQTYQQRGFLLIKIWDSPFAKHAIAVSSVDPSAATKRPVCFLEAGVLSSFFSQLTGRDLHCVQTTCESLGADCNTFVLGLRDRLLAAEEMANQNVDHATIMQSLCGESGTL
ncbi:V4R domain-containing protein [Trichothermofontia sp.]